MRIHKYATPWILVLCFWRRYAWISTQRDMNDALVFATKYVNTEAATPFIIIFAYDIVFFASALTYFGAETSASYISRCVGIQGYLLETQRTNIHGDPYLWILISHLQRWFMVDYVLLLKNSSRYNIVLVEFKLLLGLTS